MLESKFQMHVAVLWRSPCKRRRRDEEEIGTMEETDNETKRKQ